MVFSMRRTSMFKTGIKAVARRLPKLILALMALWTGGLIWFTGTQPQPGPNPGENIDGIVVLTGGQGRISAGLEALGAGNGKRLLISGVNQELANDTIRQAIDGDNPLFDCCIDFGRAALNTRGNADESAIWALEHNFRSLLVVTSDYHIARSLIEFQQAMPDIRLYARPVTEETGLWRLVMEYNKYLFSLVRVRFF